MVIAGALAITGLAAGEPASPAVASSALHCEAGYTYSVSRDGVLREIDPAGTITKVGNGSWKGESINGLGLSMGGTEAFAYERTNLGPYGHARGATILRYDASTGEFRSTGDYFDSGINGSLIAGAVDLSTGKYWFGGFEGVSRGFLTGELRFRLFEYDPAKAGSRAAFSEIGFFWTGITYNTVGATPGANGDMAFDAAGNLYVVRASDTGINIYTVTDEELSESAGGELSVHATPTKRVTLPATNGIAFDADGTVDLGASSAANRHDPNTWALMESRTTALQESTDLANCASPATLTLQKNVQSRKQASDQFELSIHRNGTVLDRQTTSGTALGVQPVKAGPTPVVSGQSYKVRETGAAGTNLGDYTSAWSCRNANTGQQLSQGEGGTGTVTIPKATSTVGPSIVCEISNAADTSLTLQKDFAIAYGAEARPEDWSLHATPKSGAALNFASGERKTVEAGSYRIGEGARPGYELDSVSCAAGGTQLPVDAQGAVTLPAGKDTVCTLVNRDLPGTVTWKKIDSVTEKPLGGSEWRLDGPGGPHAVIDNTGATGYSGLDTNPDPGAFTVTELDRGDYVLTETRAPDGYEITQTAGTKFSISNGKQEVELPAITNRKHLEFGIEKYAYADRGSSTPTLIDGANFEIRRDIAGAPGAVVEKAVTEIGTGSFSVRGLQAGKYWLVETQSPAGYAPLVEPVAFAVLHDKTHPGGAIELSGKADPLIALSDDRKTITVSDARTVALPEAGGTGARFTPLLGLGIALGGLAALGVTALQLRRRSSSER